MELEIIGSGAEAIIYKGTNIVIKDRIKKNYRHPVIDQTLRKARTRREAKILSKLKEIGFPSPILMDFDDKEMKVNMEFIYGDKLRDVFHKDPIKFSKEIGEKMAILHNNQIIHQDLTTSNMILRGKNIHFIDFGLSFFSERVEDMAVDLHLLDRAMESRHHEHYPDCFKQAMKSYVKKSNKGKDVLDRFKKVSLRGRNKGKH